MRQISFLCLLRLLISVHLHEYMYILLFYTRAYSHIISYIFFWSSSYIRLSTTSRHNVFSRYCGKIPLFTSFTTPICYRLLFLIFHPHTTLRFNHLLQLISLFDENQHNSYIYSIQYYSFFIFFFKICYCVCMCN